MSFEIPPHEKNMVASIKKLKYIVFQLDIDLKHRA